MCNVRESEQEKEGWRCTDCFWSKVHVEVSRIAMNWRVSEQIALDARRAS